MSHEPFCEGAHLDVISCREVTDWRARERNNPHHCWYSRTGYHGFVSEYPAPDETCRYDGCGRTWAEISHPEDSL